MTNPYAYTEAQILKVVDETQVIKTFTLKPKAGIGFRAAKAEAGRYGQRHLIAAMGEEGCAWPAVMGQHVERLGDLISWDFAPLFGFRAILGRTNLA